MRMWIVLPFVFAAAGCSSYRPIARQTPADTPVRVRFASTRDVVARTPAGDSLLLTNLRELRGAVVSATADTVHVRIATLRKLPGSHGEAPAGAIAAVPRDALVRIDAKTFDGEKTGGAVLLVAVGVAVGGLLLLLAVASMPLG